MCSLQSALADSSHQLQLVIFHFEQNLDEKPVACSSIMPGFMSDRDGADKHIGTVTGTSMLYSLGNGRAGRYCRNRSSSARLSAVRLAGKRIAAFPRLPKLERFYN